MDRFNIHYYCLKNAQANVAEKRHKHGKLTGKVCKESGGRKTVEVYDDRIHVFTSYHACCVAAAKVEYLEKLDFEKKRKRS